MSASEQDDLWMGHEAYLDSLPGEHYAFLPTLQDAR